MHGWVKRKAELCPEFKKERKQMGHGVNTPTKRYCMQCGKGLYRPMPYHARGKGSKHARKTRRPRWNAALCKKHYEAAKENGTLAEARAKALALP